ncbi:kinase-like domain-containing protein [Dactylonectria estremocensis]|uniref:mitogen-activated protein kinase n=1 Tax=Dactylonectria estremocensis TaxID=1079267 RepID=A0A9P9EB16_9HYPO|nr:kinase-like domain-containing protein [Dactylonectria estremocensis]
MSIPHAHPLSLFCLKPLNARALEVANDPNNIHILSKHDPDKPCLEIGHVRSKVGNTTTLATLGRDGDVSVQGSSISKVQCSFEIESDTGLVVWGGNAAPFERERPRKVVVLPDLNTIIGMGGVGGALVQFELHWHVETGEVADRVKFRQRSTLDENPRLAQTTNWADTALPSRMGTRVHMAGPQKPRIRYRISGDPLGSGRFGTVYPAINVDTGRFMAVKILRTMHCETEMSDTTAVFDAFKSEVEALSRLRHRHIVEFIGCQIVDGAKFEIFTELKQGSLRSLVENETSVVAPAIYRTALQQMLQAIDYLAMKGFVHRDVKPENIFYSPGSQAYDFKLGDFGSCTRAGIRTSTVGSFLYMAPETSQVVVPTHGVDVWALFITILWTGDMCGFRKTSSEFRSSIQVHEWISKMISERACLSPIRDMANPEPSKRASASQMLEELFGGEELASTWTFPGSTTGQQLGFRGSS